MRDIELLSSCKVTRQRVPGSNLDDLMAVFYSRNWFLFSECKCPYWPIDYISDAKKRQKLCFHGKNASDSSGNRTHGSSRTQKLASVSSKVAERKMTSQLLRKPRVTRSDEKSSEIQIFGVF